MKILVADDNDDIRQLFCRALTSRGVETVCVARGLMALWQYHDALNKGVPFDALVLDVAMPDISGFTVGQVIRLLEEASTNVPRSRLIFHSAHSELVNHERLVAVKADAYIEKASATADDILAVVFDTCSQAAGTATLPSDAQQ